MSPFGVNATLMHTFDFFVFLSLVFLKVNKDIYISQSSSSRIYIVKRQMAPRQVSTFKRLTSFRSKAMN